MVSAFRLVASVKSCRQTPLYGATLFQRMFSELFTLLEHRGVFFLPKPSEPRVFHRPGVQFNDCTFPESIL
jgi:hypothetical protein